MHNFLEEVDFGEGVLETRTSDKVELFEDTTLEEILEKCRGSYPEEELIYVFYDNGYAVDVVLTGEEGKRHLQVAVYKEGDYLNMPFKIKTTNMQRLLPLTERAIEKVQEIRSKEAKKNNIFECEDFGEGVIEKIIYTKAYDENCIPVIVHGGHDDFFTVEYDNHYIVNFELREGRKHQKYFIVEIIEDGDWENPIYIERKESFEEIKEKVREAIAIVQKFRREGIINGEREKIMKFSI